MYARIRGLAAIAMVTLVTLLVAACGSSRDEMIVAASSSSVVPMETLEDWVTYGDHLVELTVLDERRIPPTEEEMQRGEGTIGRRITVKVNDVYGHGRRCARILSCPISS